MSAHLLHTSDWHLGSSVRGESRAADHDEVIDEIVAVAERRRPDLILHTGDLFDSARPGHDELLRALRAVRRLGEIAPVVVLAGNHDSASSFELLAEAVGCPPPSVTGRVFDPTAVCTDRIRFLPRPCTAAKGAVATYAAADGTRIRLAALPFVHANRVLTDFEDVGQLNATYADRVRAVTESLTAAAFDDFDPSTTVAVWAAHLHVHGAAMSSERSVHVAEHYATDPQHLSAGFSYLAFGHIHKPQALPGGRGRYAGSPVEVDFGEEGEAKGVVAVTAEPGLRATIEVEPLTGGRRILRTRATMAQLEELAPAIGRAIVEVTVDDPPADVESLAAVVRDALPDATVVQVLDGRRRAELTIDELVDADGAAAAGASESTGAAYRRWLADGGAESAPPGADLARVAALFDELLGDVELGTEPDPAEAADLARLETADAVGAAGAGVPVGGDARSA